MVGVGVGVVICLVWGAVVVTANSLDLLRLNEELRAHNSRLGALEARAGREKQNG